MRNLLKAKFALWMALGVLASVGVRPAWSQVTTATFYGIVQDSSGAVIPGVDVTLTHEGTSAVITKTTDQNGEFTFDFLRIGDYSLRIEAPGFKAFSSTGIGLAAAQRVRQTYTLEVGDVTETIEVAGEIQQLNTIAAEQRESLSSREVTELPMAQRSFQNVLTLGTGIQTTADGGVRMNGLGRSGLKITVDGTDASSNPENPGTALKNNFNYIHVMSIEAIQEVQTTKGVTPAEYGHQLSGNVNLIAKSGTNQWHGTFFETFKAENLNAADRRLRVKPPFTFNQFGGSVGGPIRKDRMFIFGTYEGYRESSFAILQGDVPTQKLRDEAIAADPSYAIFLDTLHLPNQPHAPNADTGRFLGSGAESKKDNHAVIKSDNRIGDSGNLAVTYTRGRPYQITLNGRTQIGNTREFFGEQERLTASYTTGGAAWTSESRFGYNYNNSERTDGFWNIGLRQDTPEDVMGGRRTPSIQVDGLFGNGGGAEIINNFGPVWSIEQKYARHTGTHSLKFGGIYNNRTTGRFNIENNQIRYANKADFLANIPSRVQTTFGNNRYEGSASEFGVFAQDDWRVRQDLVLNIGIRYDYFSKWFATATDPNAPAALYNLDGLLDGNFNFGPFRDPEDPYESDGWANLGPRIGFSYSPGSGNTVLRGGWGVMFSPLPLDEFNRATSESPALPRRIIFSQADAINRGLKFPTYNDDVRAQLTDTGMRYASSVFDPEIQSPYTMQFYLGVQRALTPSLMVESAFVGNRGVKFRLGRGYNWPDRVTGIRPNPTLGEGVYYCSCQDTVYTSWQTSLRKSYSKGLTYGVHYTWGKALSTAGGDTGADFSGDTVNAIQDFFNIAANRGPSTGDTTHRLTGDWVYELPSFGGQSGVAQKLLGGWQISGVFSAQSGQAAYISQNGLTSRPDYVGGEPINPNFRHDGIYLNRSAFRLVPLGTGGNPIRSGTLGNNAIRGTARYLVDISLGKTFEVTERIGFQIRADAFNALNHTGFAAFTNSINSANFGRFTDFYPARQMQLNARLSW